MNNQQDSAYYVPTEGNMGFRGETDQPGYISLNISPDVEVLRLDKDGMLYQGTRIEDAGEAYAAWMDVMSQRGYKKPLTNDEIKAMAEEHLSCDDWFYTFGNDGIKGWLTFARAVLKGRT